MAPPSDHPIHPADFGATISPMNSGWRYIPWGRTIRYVTPWVGDTVEDEAIARIGVRSGYLRERCSRLVSKQITAQDRDIVVPEPTKGNRDKSRRPCFMMGCRNLALAVHSWNSALYNVLRFLTDRSVSCEEDPSVLLGTRQSWSSDPHPVGSSTYSWLSPVYL